MNSFLIARVVLFSILSTVILGKRIRRYISLQEAARKFNDKVEEAFASGTKSSASEPAHPVGGNAATPLNADENQEAARARKETHDQEQMKRIVNGAKPNLQGYVCMQLGIDLSVLLPGLKLKLGFVGGVRRNSNTKCWGMVSEVALGFDWGFSVYGYGLGLGASVTGTLDVSEVPGSAIIAKVTSGKNLSEVHVSTILSYAPEGSDPNYCHTGSLWSILMTFIMHEYRNIFHLPQVQDDLNAIVRERQYIERQDAFLKVYDAMLNHRSSQTIVRTRPLFMRISRTNLLTANKTHAFHHLNPKTLNFKRRALDDTHMDEVRGFEHDESLYSRSAMGGNDILAMDENVDLVEMEKLSKGQHPSRYLNMHSLIEAIGSWSEPECPEEQEHCKEALFNEGVALPAIAMQKAANKFVLALPAYAQQIMPRLIDNSKRGDTDGEFHLGFLGTGSWKRLRAADGRHLARWPSDASFEDVKTGNQSKPIGVYYQRSGIDDRVLNFPKIMRVSENTGKLDMWRETAMSASNLLVRTVSDVKTLFSAAFANDLAWDGVCESLPIAFRVSDEFDEKLMQKHAWASEYVDASARSSFANGERVDVKGREHARLLNGVARWVVRDSNGTLLRNPELYPHLWCILAEKHMGEKRDIQLEVTQACVSVSVKEYPLKHGDKIRWKAHPRSGLGYYVVMRNDVESGVLFGEVNGVHGDVLEHGFRLTGNDATDIAEAIKRGFRIKKRKMEDRQDCERVTLPSSFQVLFPSFVSLVQSLVARMEEVLLHINMCMGTSHNTRHLLSKIPNERTWRREAHPCLKFNDKLAYISGKAKDAVRLVRWFLFQLGAEDPKECPSCSYKFETLPLDWYEQIAIEANKQRFAALANQMALDFAAALGVGPTDEALEKFPFIADGLDATRFDRMIGSSEKFIMEGFLWQRFYPLKDEILFTAAEPRRRLSNSLVAKVISPPLEYTTGFVFTSQLGLNGFCTSNSAPIVVTRSSQTTRRTWSSVTSHEICWTGRLRPGSFYIQISRCTSSIDGEIEDISGYVDWRIRMTSVLVGGNILSPHETGIIGNAFTSPHGMIEALVQSGAGLVAGMIGGGVVDKLAPRLANNPITSSLLMLAATSAPALAVLTAEKIVDKVAFEGICKRFLDHLANHGIVSSPGSNPFGFTVSSALLVWGVVVHRVKEITLLHGPALVDNQPTKIKKQQRFLSLHFENWNLATLTMPVPFAASLQVVGRVEINWNLTPWYVAKKNKELQKQNEGRIAFCLKCFEDGRAFCDWRPPLTSAWSPDHDECVDNNEVEERKCTQFNGATDDLGNDVRAVWYHPGNSSSCNKITYTKPNQEFAVSRSMQRFSRRH